jgi:hypothetical protein
VSRAEPPPLQKECALCGDQEALRWADVRGSLDKVRRVAVCEVCNIDLRASDADVDEDGDE